MYCLMDVNVPFRYYFLFDTLTVAMTNFVYTGRLRWLAAIQMCQHLFFVFTWNEHPYTNKVVIHSYTQTKTMYMFITKDSFYNLKHRSFSLITDI